MIFTGTMSDDKDGHEQPNMGRIIHLLFVILL